MGNREAVFCFIGIFSICGVLLLFGQFGYLTLFACRQCPNEKGYKVKSSTIGESFECRYYYKIGGYSHSKRYKELPLDKTCTIIVVSLMLGLCTVPMLLCCVMALMSYCVAACIDPELAQPEDPESRGRGYPRPCGGRAWIITGVI